MRVGLELGMRNVGLGLGLGSDRYLLLLARAEIKARYRRDIDEI